MGLGAAALADCRLGIVCIRVVVLELLMSAGHLSQVMYEIFAKHSADSDMEATGLSVHTQQNSLSSMLSDKINLAIAQLAKMTTS